MTTTDASFRVSADQPDGEGHMTACCEEKSCDITGMRERHARVLWVVLLINRAYFDLWYSVPPTKGGHSYGAFTFHRPPDPAA